MTYLSCALSFVPRYNTPMEMTKQRRTRGAARGRGDTELGEVSCHHVAPRVQDALGGIPGLGPPFLSPSAKRAPYRLFAIGHAVGLVACVHFCTDLQVVR